MPGGMNRFDPKAFLLTIGEGIATVNWRKDATVFAQGDEANALYFIQSGKVKITAVSAQGKEAVVAILGAGDFFGEGCMAGQSLRISTARTLVESSIAHLEKTAVVRFLGTQPAFAETFTSYLLARNIRIEADLIDQLFNSSEKRLARLLLLLANFGKEGQPHSISTPISQETLAEMVGTTRARVSHFMNRFRRLGFIEYNGNIEVHSSLLSVMLLDELSPRNGGARNGPGDGAD